MERALVRAKPLPIHMPIGCRPRPPQWPTFEQDFASVDEATRAWAETVACIEAEVQQLWGIEGAEARQASGRGGGPTGKAALRTQPCQAHPCWQSLEVDGSDLEPTQQALCQDGG